MNDRIKELAEQARLLGPRLGTRIEANRNIMHLGNMQYNACKRTSS